MIISEIYNSIFIYIYSIPLDYSKLNWSGMVWDSLGSTGDKLDRAGQLGTLLGELEAAPVCPVCHTLDSTGQLRAGLLMQQVSGKGIEEVQDSH